MKHLLLILTFTLTSLSFVQAQFPDAPETQRPLISKIAASWCPPCGGWGWNFFDDIYEDNSSEAIFLSIHHSGDHSNGTATDLTQNFGVFGQPRFIFNSADQNVTSGNSSTKRTDIMNMVVDQNTASPKIQTGIEAAYSGDNLLVSYTVEVFENISGDYYLGLYLVEKIHVGYQSSQGQNAEHKALLRSELNGNSFGSELFSGSGFSGDLHQGSIQVSLENYDPENLEIVSIIWKKNGDTFEVVNTNKDDSVADMSTSSVDDQLGEQNNLNVYPSLVEDSFTVEIDLGNKSSNNAINLYLIDSSGKQIQLISNKVTTNKKVYRFSRELSEAAGLHYIMLEQNGQREIKKVIFK